MQIIICGHGALAVAITTECVNQGLVPSVLTNHMLKSAEKLLFADPVAIHCGSGRQLGELLVWCGDNGIPMIQASSGQKLPDTVPVPVIDAPNMALPVVVFLKGLSDFVKGFEGVGLEPCLIESHQKTKKTVPETARRMADAIGLPHAEICSVRDEHVQQGLLVPHEHLGRHGYHWLKLVGDDIEVCLETKVNGLRPYAMGALHIARSIVEHRPGDFENRVYPASELI